MLAASPTRLRWTVAVTRDEPAGGPLHLALRDEGFIPVSCVVTEEHAPPDFAALRNVARALEDYDWLVCAGARSVRALQRERSMPWPKGLRTAAVGEATATALVSAGVEPAPVVAVEPGARALCAHLVATESWRGRRVLVPTVDGGRRDLVDGLLAAGALVDQVKAYRMAPRSRDEIRAAWESAQADAVTIASPSVADALVDAVGRDAIARLNAVVAIGGTTRSALAAHGIHAEMSAGASFPQIARCLTETWSRVSKGTVAT